MKRTSELKLRSSPSIFSRNVGESKRRKKTNKFIPEDLRIQVARKNFERENQSRRCSSLFSPQNCSLTIISGEFPNILFDGDLHCSLFHCGFRLVFEFSENDLSSPIFDDLSKISVEEQISQFCSQKIGPPTMTKRKTTTTTTATTTTTTTTSNIYSIFLERVHDITSELLRISSMTKPIQQISFFFPRMFEAPKHFEELRSFVADVLSSQCIQLDMRQQFSELYPMCHSTFHVDSTKGDKMKKMNEKGPVSMKKEDERDLENEEETEDKDDSDLDEKKEDEEKNMPFAIHYCRLLKDFPKEPKFCRLISEKKCSLIDILTFFPQIHGQMFSKISHVEKEQSKRLLIVPFQTDCADNFVKLLNVLCHFLCVDFIQAFGLLKSCNFQKMFP